MNRREFLDLLTKGAIASALAGCNDLRQTSDSDFYTLPRYGDARLLHITDTHAQLLPIHFREPNVNIGVGAAKGRLPHVVGNNLLNRVPVTDPRLAHALTYLDFTEAAERFGKVGGFSHLKTLLDQLRAQADGQSLLLDGGDTWQGSATALWTRGRDMVDAGNLLGVDVMTGHWEFTYPDTQTRENVRRFNGAFVAQNILATQEALFEGVEVFDEDTGRVFQPYVVKELDGHRIAVVGQAFPYTPIANPRRFIPNWTFGIQEQALQALVHEIRQSEGVDAVVLLSHNGMDVDLKLASRITGINFILGGHTHDGVPVPVAITNPGGKTIVTNAGSNGKFVGVLDIEFGKRGVSGYRYRLLPVFSNLLDPDAQMAQLIAAAREPYLERLQAPLAVAESLLYRRGNFNGTFDQIICDALCAQLDAEISLSPGFRWGTTVLPGETITMERLMDQTAMTYPETYVREMTGEAIKSVLENVGDNLFNPDPYYQQGGDMVRVGGLRFSCAPNAAMGKRISDLTLADGTRLNPVKSYKVAGWATVDRQSEGPAVWDVVANHLRAQKSVKVGDLNQPTLEGVHDNVGIADYS